MIEPETARALYRKLLAFYPRGFRDELGESMQQTFNDLYRERRAEHRLVGFLLWMVAETGLGILRERVLNNLFTIDGQQGQIEINMLGRVVIYGGLLLLPVAFALDLQPMLKKEGPDGKRKLYAINLIVGAIISLLIIFTWGGLILEQTTRQLCFNKRYEKTSQRISSPHYYCLSTGDAYT